MTADYTVIDILTMAAQRCVVAGALCFAGGAFFAWLERKLS